ncbi:MAG: phosphate/phosphite/phosphonate ABC transporter substrate-binding protein [Bdellovibrionota bacterium]|nr:alkylphosphonate ABC transporter [Pseudobdellovibrionaceae bacterium]
MRNILILLISSIFSLNIWAAKPEQITIGFIPAGPSNEFKAKGLEFAELVQKELGIPVKVFIPKNYESLVQAMKDKKVDFAFFTAMTFVHAEKEANAKVLLRKVWEGRDYYFSSLVVPQNSEIKSLKDIKGKSIAYVDKDSTSGFLYPSLALKDQGLDPQSSFSKVIFSGNHKKSVLDLEDGKAEVAAMFAADKEGKTGAWTHLFDKGKQMRAIWVSKPIPSDPFCVRNDFYEKHPNVAHDFMFFLKDISSAKNSNHPLKKLLDVDKVKLATSKQYDPVREMVKKLNIKL